MTIIISGRAGEGKTCVANIIRQAMENAGVVAAGFGLGLIPHFDAQVAAEMLPEKLRIQIIEEHKDK